MKIADYLKKCRKSLQLTQESLVHRLYTWDDEHFGGIDTATVSKWERGVTAPPIPRLQALLSFFQEQSSLPLPCREDIDEERATKELMSGEVSKVVGRPRQLVGQLPLTIDFSRGFRLASLRGHPRADELLEIAAMMIESSNPDYSKVSAEKLGEWIEYPANLFQVLSYKSAVLGLLFTLRLKPESFEEVLTFGKRKSDLTHEDFASEDEPASLYALAYYAMTPQVGTILLARLYAHLIAHQKTLRELGLVSPLSEVHRIAENIGLKATGTKEADPGPLKAYRNDLYTVLSSPPVLKSLFEK